MHRQDQEKEMIFVLKPDFAVWIFSNGYILTSLLAGFQAGEANKGSAQ